MAPLTRCPHCDTFVKKASLDDGECPFCPTANAASIRNPIPGLVLAATIAVMPGCSEDAKPKPGVDSAVYGVAAIDAGLVDAAPPGVDGAVYGIAIDAAPDAGEEDAMPVDPDAAPIYGIAPE